MNSRQITTFKVRSGILAGKWWVRQCMIDHSNNLNECCVPGATPNTCEDCLQECVKANAWESNFDQLVKCTLNHKCFG